MAPGTERGATGARRSAAEMGEVSHVRAERNFSGLREARGAQPPPGPAAPATAAGRPPAPGTARTAPARPPPPRRGAPLSPAHLARPHLAVRSGPVRPPRAEALSVLRGRDAGTRAAPRMGGGAPPPGVPERGCSAPQDPRRLPGGRTTASAAPPLPWLRPRLAPTAWLGPRLLPPGGRAALRRPRGRRGATGRGAWPPRPALGRPPAAPSAGGAGGGGSSPQPEGGGERHLPTAPGRGRAGGEAGHGRGAVEPLDAGAASAPAAVGTCRTRYRWAGSGSPGPRRFPAARCWRWGSRQCLSKSLRFGTEAAASVILALQKAKPLEAHTRRIYSANFWVCKWKQMRICPSVPAL